MILSARKLDIRKLTNTFTKTNVFREEINAPNSKTHSFHVKENDVGNRWIVDTLVQCYNANFLCIVFLNNSLRVVNFFKDNETTFKSILMCCLVLYKICVFEILNRRKSIIVCEIPPKISLEKLFPTILNCASVSVCIFEWSPKIKHTSPTVLKVWHIFHLKEKRKMVLAGNRLALCCRNMFSNVLVISVFFVYIAIADIGLPSSHQDQDNLLAQLKLPQCREHCMDKVCLQFNVFVLLLLLPYCLSLRWFPINETYV